MKRLVPKEKGVRSSAYKLEYAASSRALCRLCKTTIPKDSLRLGTYKLPLEGPDPGFINPPTPAINPNTPDGGSYRFQHWGCTSTRQLSILAEDGKYPDGFDELKEEDKTKVREAVERGWVDEEDWAGKPVGTKYKKPGWKGPRGRKKAKRLEGNLRGVAKERVEAWKKTQEEKKARELGEAEVVDTEDKEEAEEEEENKKEQQKKTKRKARALAVDVTPAKRAKLAIPPPASTAGSSKRTSGKITTTTTTRPRPQKKKRKYTPQL